MLFEYRSELQNKTDDCVVVRAFFNKCFYVPYEYKLIDWDKDLSILRKDKNSLGVWKIKQKNK